MRTNTDEDPLVAKARALAFAKSDLIKTRQAKQRYESDVRRCTDEITELEGTIKTLTAEISLLTQEI